MADRGLDPPTWGAGYAAFAESIRRVAQEEAAAREAAIKKELKGLYDKYDELKRIVVDNEIRTTLVEDQFPKNAKVATLAREGHIHEEADIGGGADCMFDYLVSPCAAENGISEGQVFQSLTGCDFKVYSTRTGAITDANTNRQTAGQDSVLYICSGDYVQTATQSVAPPANGSYHFIGSSRAAATIIAGANSITLDSIATLTGSSMVTYRDLGFDDGSYTPVTLIDFTTNARGFIEDCWLDVGANAANIGIKPGFGVIGVQIGHNLFTGVGIGIGGSTQSDAFIHHNIFESGLAIGIKMGAAVATGAANFLIDTNDFFCTIGIQFIGAIAISGSAIRGNLFEVVSKGIEFAADVTQEDTLMISGNIFRNIGNGLFGIDFNPLGSFAVFGVNVNDNVFSGTGTGIGIRGDTTGQKGCVATDNMFRGFTSGNEITDWTGTGNVSFHNKSVSSTGVDKPMADIGSPVGHVGTGTGGAAPNNAQYLTLAADATLTAERVFTPRYNIFGTDGGAGAAYSLDSWLEGALITPSAGTLTLGTDGDAFHVAAGDFAAIATPTRQTLALLVFDGVSVLTHGANLILQGAVNLTSAAGDTMILFWEGGAVWREVNRHTAAIGGATAHNLLDGSVHPDTLSKSPTLAHTIVGDGADWTSQFNATNQTAAPTITDDSGDGYAIGSRWYDTTGDREYVCLDATAGAAVWLPTTGFGTVLSPSSLGAGPHHDYAPAGWDSSIGSLRLSTTGTAKTITGITGGWGGRLLLAMNIGAVAIILQDDNTVDSTAANRFDLNGDTQLSGDESILLWYDGTTSRWRGLHNRVRHQIRENGAVQTDRGNLDFIDAAAGAGLITDDGATLAVNLDLYLLKANANYVDLTDGGATTLHSHAGGSGHTIREDGIGLTARTGLNFVDTDVAAAIDDAAGDETEIRLNLYAALAGRSGGQELKGGTGSGDDLTLTSTNHATKGEIVISDALRLTKGTSANIDANDEIVVPAVSWLYLTSASATDNLDGIGAGSEGQVVFLTPATGKDITLVHNGTVTAGKKLMLSTRANFLMDNDEDFVIAVYDATTTTWNVMVPLQGKRQLKIIATSLAVHATNVLGWTVWEAPDSVTVRAVLNYLGDPAVSQTWLVQTADPGSAFATVATITLTYAGTSADYRTVSATDITLTEGKRVQIVHTTGGTAGTGVEITLDEQ